MTMVLDAVVGKLLDELLNVIVEKKNRAVNFRPTLELLEDTLNRTRPWVENIYDLNKQMDRPAEETKWLTEVIEQIRKGKDLVEKCSKVQWWDFRLKADYQKKLEDLKVCIDRFFQYEMQGQTNRNSLEALVGIKDVREELGRFVPRRNELTGVCLPPEPPAFTVGLDVHLNELKFRLLNGHHGAPAPVLTITGGGGSGKSTLAKKFCWDEDVKGIFKENIFFITFAKSPNLNTIVQRLFQHSGYKTPEFQSEDDMIYQLEHLLKQILAKSPILLVLDDVWRYSVSLVVKFVFKIPNYTILITSRFAITEFGPPPYVLKRLDEDDAIKLLRHSASLVESRYDIPDDVVKKIAGACCGSPLALEVSGTSLRRKQALFWHNRARALSSDRSKIVSNNEVLTSLQKSFDDLDPNVAECFRDLSLFPEAQRIPASALIDISAELRHQDDGSAMENIYELVNRNMADLVITRYIASDSMDYNYHYVTQHGLLRDLTIFQTKQEPTEKSNRLIVDISGNKLPEWWTSHKEYHFAAKTFSISTDEAFTSEWCNLQPTEVEVLVLNLREKKHTLPMFMKKMNKLKVLIITNHDFHRADLENFEVLDYLPDLKRVRLEKVSIAFLTKTGVQLKNLKKISFSMCNVNEAFKNGTSQISDVLPNLEEMNIDYCDLVQFPNGLSDIVSLKRLSITNCDKLSALPEGIGNLVNLESLRLTSCTSLVELPDSITGLHNLKFLDISNCVRLGMLPENIGELSSLERLHCIDCVGLNKLPYSITDLGSLRVVVCDEWMARFWRPFKIFIDIHLDVAQVDFNLNSLL